MNSKVYYIALKAAKSYIYDGYHLDEYFMSERPPQSIYVLKHKNGNRIKVIGDELDEKVYIYLNGKPNKTIKI